MHIQSILKRYFLGATLLALLNAPLAVTAEPTRALKAIAGDSHRIALVIGNSAYTNSPLKNPVNDAKDVASKLRGLGFDVIERDNLQTKQIGGTLREFRSKLTPGSVALVFYAGHGLQIKGENYLPAVDADINTEEDVPNQSLAVRQIMDVLDEAKTRLNLVFLDACRNNPYARSFRSADGGLARVTAPSGTLISYATKPGGVSADGAGRNGLYTSKLLAQMDSNLQIELALKRIVTEVKAASQGKQEPWMEGSIEGDFCFPGCASGSNSVANLVPVLAPMPGTLSLDDIKKNQDVRGQWDKWQQSMKADYDKVGALNAATDLQVAAWDRFLVSYSQNNPYSTEDEQLRASAQSRKQAAKPQLVSTNSTVQTGKTFRDCAGCPEMVVIPAGSFEMGSSMGEVGRRDNEGPVHRVTIKKPFALGKTEITRGQFATFVSETGYSTGDTCVIQQGETKAKYGRGSWHDPGYRQDDKHPAVCLSWNDAKAYIEWLSRKTGKQYRLPSEAEWEYAARGNTVYARYWGDRADRACGYANVMDANNKTGSGKYDIQGARASGVTDTEIAEYLAAKFEFDIKGARAEGYEDAEIADHLAGLKLEAHNCTDGFAYTAPVGNFKPNTFGLYDMIGNVLEWVEDSYHDDYVGNHRTKTWNEVEQNPEFKTLSSDEQEEARNQYFIDVVAPKVLTEDLVSARAAFDAETKPSYTTVASKAVQSLFKSENTQKTTANSAPSDGSPWQENGAQRVLRGGMWNDAPQNARAATRRRDEPTFRSSYYGFRLARISP